MTDIDAEVERVADIHNFPDDAVEPAKPLAARKRENGWKPKAYAAFSALAEVVADAE